ncbi:MAG: indole-3-glycerol-phosphate synthase, partial [Aristaeellaceae bacterium]
MAATILDTIAAYALERVAADKSAIPPEAMADMARQDPPVHGAAFEQALRRPGMSFICEVKRASPSKGLIAPDFPYIEIARAYEAAGADCLSCLTEPKWFLGSDDIFREIRGTVALPMLRKDFVVDAYQIDQ